MSVAPFSVRVLTTEPQLALLSSSWEELLKYTELAAAENGISCFGGRTPDFDMWASLVPRLHLLALKLPLM